MYFEKDYTLTFGHIDNREINRPSAMFEFMQDIATDHADMLHLSREELGAIWVLSRLRGTLLRPLRVHERVHVRTWCVGFKGPNWLRAFELYADGEKLGEAMSTWVTLDAANHRILRPTQLPLPEDLETLLHPCELAVPGKLDCTAYTPHHVHTVRYSDLDVNGHMNNVKIVDVLCDGLDLEQRDGQFVRTLQVNYTSECMPGERIEIETGEDTNGLICLRGQAGGKTKFEAAAQLAPYDRR